MSFLRDLFRQTTTQALAAINKNFHQRPFKPLVPQIDGQDNVD